MTPSAWLPPKVEVYQADTQDSDLATAQTIATMCGHIHHASQDPVVQQAAKQALSTWGRVRWGTSAPVGVFWWAKHTVKVLPHSKFKALLAAYPAKRQLLVIPEVVLRAPSPAGDCSTFSMLIAAMLESLGAQWELVTVAADPQDPKLYSHVFVRAVLRDGSRVTLDGSHGKYPGWEVPRAHQFRRQVWDAAGEPISDQAPVVSQLHEYLATGLGDDSFDVGYVDTADESSYASTPTDATLSELGLSTSTTDLSSVFDSITGGATPTYTDASTGLTATKVGSNSGYVAPSQSSSQWAAFATALAKGGMTLAEINAIQPGTVVSANGSILRQATGLPVPVGTGITAALGSSSTMLLLGGVALVVVVMLMSGKSR